MKKFDSCNFCTIFTCNCANADPESPLENFLRGEYKILPALKDDQILQAFKVRHEVFCREMGFEPTNDHQLEVDDFDDYAMQLVLSLRGTPLGCTRFVHGDKKHPLPLQGYAAKQLDQNVMHGIIESGKSYAELSRLSILPESRGDKHGKCNTEKSPMGLFASHAPLVEMILGMHAYAKLSGTDYLLATMEKKLLRCLTMFGVPIQRIGEPVEHRGTRYPILIETEKFNIPRPYQNYFWRTYMSMEHNICVQ